MLEEIMTLKKSGTWEFVDLPSGNKTAGCKCMFIVKYESNGSIERYKAHLNAKGLA